MGDRRRFPSRKHFKGRMAAKGVFSLVFACVATSQVYGKATDPPTTDPPTTDPPTTDPPTTPSLRPNQRRHTGETRTPCVDPRGLGFATSTATLTVATSSLLPVLQGASLP